jgi:hypothetical protein
MFIDIYAIEPYIIVLRQRCCSKLFLCNVGKFNPRCACSVQQWKEVWKYSVFYTKSDTKLSNLILRFRKMQRSGILDILHKRNFGRIMTVPEMEFKSVSLAQVTPVFVLLATATVTAVLLLQLERVMFRRAASTNKHKRNNIFRNWSKQCAPWKTLSVTNIQRIYVLSVQNV